MALKWEIGIILAILILVGLGLKSCTRPINTNPIITEAKWSEPSKEDVKTYGAKEVIKVNLAKDTPIGKKPEIKIIKTNDNKLLQVVEFKNEFRYLKNFGPYADFGITGFGGGLKLALIGYGRVNIDILAGWPRSGIGLDYQLYKNSYLGISYNYSFKSIQEPALYFTLNF